MHQADLWGIHTKKRWRQAGDRPPGATNQIAHDFIAHAPTSKWDTNTTAIPTSKGWLYLDIVVYFLSRQVIVWSMQPQMGRDLILQAVLIAI